MQLFQSSAAKGLDRRVGPKGIFFRMAKLEPIYRLKQEENRNSHKSQKKYRENDGSRYRLQTIRSK